MLPWIKVPHGFKTFVLSIFEWLLKTGFTLVSLCLIHLNTGNLYRGTLSNCEDPDEMLQYALFHQGLHCLLLLKLSSKKENHIL